MTCHNLQEQTRPDYALTSEEGTTYSTYSIRLNSQDKRFTKVTYNAELNDNFNPTEYLHI